MRDEYRKVYSDLYDNYVQPSPFIYERAIYVDRAINRQYRSFIGTSIDEAIEQLGLSGRVRPDAKYVLLINFYQMIVLPILLAQDEFKISDYNVEKLQSDIKSDIRTILKKSMLSEGSQYEEPIKEVSGGRIVSAIAALWDELRVSRIEVWSKT